MSTENSAKWTARLSLTYKFLKHVVIAVVSVAVMSVLVFFAWRFLSSGDPASMKYLTPNEKLCQAYSQQGEELYIFKQNQRSITSSEKNYGYFAITEYSIIPEANQIQTLVRYNNSTLKYTAEDHGLEQIPDRTAEVYDVTLLLAIDLTPENKDDNLGNDEESVKFVRCHGKVTGTDQKNVYNYRRMVFDLDSAEVDIKELLDSGLLLAIYADFYYVGALDYEQTPYGVLCLYDFMSKDIKVKLEKGDVKALESYKSEG